MELPQPRAFGTDGRKTTHDFLSLYSPAEQDPRPLQGGWLRTHDFLQPLEQAEKSVEKEEGNVEVRVVEKPPLPAAPPLPSMDHGGIGSYIISHLQGVSKLEGSLFSMAQPSSTDMNDENSNSSSYTGSGFTLWEESVVKKGKTGERRVLGETGVNTIGQHPTMMEWASQSSSNLRQLTAQNNQSFLNMLASARSAHEEDDEEEEEEEFVIKKEQSPYPKVTSVRKSNEQKQNTPRSKHSATEQRRRSKINDRFQMLRGIIPHSDQKRDKASFLLEVIEYIQFLQEKVQKYEGSYQGWEHEPTKFPWNKCQRGARAQPPFINNTSDPTQMFASKFADSKPGISRTAPLNGWKAEPETSTCLMNDSSHTKPFNPNIFRYCGTSSNGASQVLPKVVASERDKPTPPQQHQSPQFHVPNYAAPSHESKDLDLPIESGTISISSTYSQGLLSSLTHALQSAGVDLSQACISVHIDLGKRANGRLISPGSAAIKGDHVFTSNEPILQSILTNTGEESGQARKRIKTSRN